ncbi:hypothetical protein GXM18_17115 [Blautia producta ATCC 27340 = DSM 2950]|uniref:Uncharacterized protein n=1 Tax=Blautia producta ATCC 27340 = DSM 2950 TaxID=1121114 RepID=A0ABX6J1W2_9FIRM|nr:hypothetical protein GXM18_17115 [Blautia producta ATCC 27340 = DSM 2950]
MVWIEIALAVCSSKLGDVTTFAVVWIEILGRFLQRRYISVTTFAVVWIEIHDPCCNQLVNASPPSRWCGLKSGKGDSCGLG